MNSRRPLLPLVLAVVGALSLSACTATAEPVAETATPSVTPPAASPAARTTASPTPEASPSGASEPAPAAYTSCDEVITPALHEELDRLGWMGWNMVGQQIGHSPFDGFPGGAPAGQLSCRFGKGPEVATDNVLDLAWAPIDQTASQAAQEHLADVGFERIVAPEGVQWSVRGEAGWADADGWGQTFLFTGSDVRWAMIRDELQYLQPAV
jgi:hypothetical protein